MKTKIFAILIMLCLTVSMFTVVSADGITVTVNGESLVFDSEPIIENDRLLVPMRVIFEALGADVSWDDSSKTASAVLRNNSVRITIGESVLYKNGTKITLDCSAVVKNSRTLLPVRAVSEGLGADVDWNEKEKAVIITSVDYEQKIGEVSESDFQKFVAETTAKTAFETVDLPIEVEKYSADFADDIQNNIENAIINLGGNVLTLGQKPSGQAFIVGIEKPFEKGSFIDKIPVSGRSVVTSGIYERYFKVDGALYHHIIDPKTGYPVNTDLLSATIIADTSMQADALSTTCILLGKEKAMEYLNNQPEVSAILVTNDYKIIKVNIK